MSDEELIGNLKALSHLQVLEGREMGEVVVNGHVYMRWQRNDEAAKRMAIVQLYGTGHGTQEEIARAFGIHVNSVHNYINAVKADGIKGLVNQERGPKEAWKITPAIKFKILEAAFNHRGMALEDVEEENSFLVRSLSG